MSEKINKDYRSHPRLINFGKHFRTLRINSGYTQRGLADQLDIHFTQISRIERGLCFPSLSLLARFCDATGTELHETLDMRYLEEDD
jgi:transcriptional regulator with XRE-family HTH domain